MENYPKQDTILIRENDSLEQVLDKFSDKVSQEGFLSRLKFIFNKQHNNYVGYYLFLQDHQVYKIFVLPKIIDSLASESDLLRMFMNYLGEFYRLNGKTNRRLESPLEIAFGNLQKDSSSQKDLDSFLYHKYGYLLKEIELFFRGHQKKNTRQISYTAQAIRHKFDLVKNVRSPDKSIVHQTKTEEYVYSELARIAYGAIRLFMENKLNLIANEKQKDLIEQKCRILNALLLQRFHFDRAFTIRIHALLSLSTYQHFRKTHSSQKVYRKLLMLFGLERFFDEEDADIHYDLKGEYLFFRAEDLYELLVKEWLFEKYPNYDVTKKASKSYKTSRNGLPIQFETKSEPDFVLQHNDKKIIFDAKWKILNNTSDLDIADILKLERDVKVHEASQAILVYCKINQDVIKGKWISHYCDSGSFEFEVLEVPFQIAPSSLS